MKVRWGGSMAEVFICYSRKHQKLAAELDVALTKLGYDSWADKPIEGYQGARNQIDDILSMSRILIIIWSEPVARHEVVLNRAVEWFPAGTSRNGLINVMPPGNGDELIPEHLRDATTVARANTNEVLDSVERVWKRYVPGKSYEAKRCEQDFSWEGLAAKKEPGDELIHPWKGWVIEKKTGTPHRKDDIPENSETRPASLQDYWENQKDKLFEGPNGKKYTMFHLPSDGKKDDASKIKAEWPSDECLSFYEEIAQRLLTAQREIAQQPSNDRRSQDIDMRAQLQGVVFPSRSPEGINIGSLITESDSTGRIAACFDYAHFIDDVVLDDVAFAANVSFRHAFFEGYAWFSDVIFHGEANFERAIFKCAAAFEGAVFHGAAKFENVTFFKLADFNDARFRQGSSFADADIRNDLDFKNAQFQGDAFFRDARIWGRVWFDGARFLQAQSSSGESDNDLKNCTASFVNAEFYRAVSFYKIETKATLDFSGVRLFDYATFAHAKLYEPTLFRKTKTLTNSTFGSIGTVTSSPFISRYSNIVGGLCFEGGEFFGRVDFSQACFGTRKISFARAVFHNVASFKGIEWATEPAKWEGAFHQTVFKEAPDFRGASDRVIAAFNSTRFENGVNIDELGRRDKVDAEGKDEQVRKQDRKTSFRSKHEQNAFHVARKYAFAYDNDQGARQARVMGLEGGSRALRKAMQPLADKGREHTFFRYELIARRRNHSVSHVERFFLRLYGLLSDYGQGVLRPFTWFVFFVAAATGYTYYLTRDLGNSFLYFWGRTMPGSNFAEAAFKKLEGTDPNVNTWGLVIRIVGDIYIVFAALMLFFILLAVRRKFQLSD